jgi:hypothetical protein
MEAEWRTRSLLGEATGEATKDADDNGWQAWEPK